jgi:hypothetical protein
MMPSPFARSHWKLALALGTLLVGGAPALHAQEGRAPAPTPVGDYVMSFSLPSGGGPGFGIGHQWSPRTRIQFQVAVDWEQQDTELAEGVPSVRTRDLSIEGGPELRIYGLLDRPVLPFFHLTAFGGYEESSLDPSSLRFGGEVGVGAEWFPVRGVGISGQSGFRLVRSAPRENLSPSVTTLRGALFRSGLSLNLYF